MPQAESLELISVKMYAAVSPSGAFEFSSVAQRKKDVRILESDAKYGKLVTQPVLMTLFDDEIPTSAADAFRLWDSHQLAWVWQNSDESFWWDTLSLTRADAAGWVSKPDIMAALGTKLVPVQFRLQYPRT